MQDTIGEDILDTRNLAERFADLLLEAEDDPTVLDSEEFLGICKLGEELGGDRDDLPEFFENFDDPVLIHERYFKSYAQDLADDIGVIPSEYTWPISCIDWDKAAKELKMDYTSVTVDGHTYYYR